MGNQASRRARFHRLQSLLFNWVFSVGIVTLLVMMSPYIDKLIFPGVVLLFQYMLMRYSHRWSHLELRCNLLPHVMSCVLFFSAIVMVAINFYYLKFVDPSEFLDGCVNKSIPYITILIVAPISVIALAWSLTRRRETIFCRECQLNNGHLYSHGFVGRMLSKEARYQARLFFIISLITTVYTWTYYALCYVNVCLSATDRFVYVWLPTIVYLLSVVYMTLRYWFVLVFCEKNILTEGLPPESATLLRFIVMCDGKIFLASTDVNGRAVFDTPFSRTVDSTVMMDETLAAVNFAAVTGWSLDGADFRVLYQTNRHSGNGNVFHILVSLPSSDVVSIDDYTSGCWLTPYQISKSLADGRLSVVLGSEIHRVYTVAMAYKAYYRTGLRRYAIRHYTPGFHLDELIGIEVDFNDPVWLLVAKDNEDRPLFHLRRFWRKYVVRTEL